MFIIPTLLIAVFVIGAVYFLYDGLINQRDLPAGWDSWNSLNIRRGTAKYQGLTPWEATMLDLSEMTYTRFRQEEDRLNKISEFACEQTYGVSLVSAKTICEIIQVLRLHERTDLERLAISRFDLRKEGSYSGEIPEKLKGLNAGNWLVIYQRIIPNLSE